MMTSLSRKTWGYMMGETSIRRLRLYGKEKEERNRVINVLWRHWCFYSGSDSSHRCRRKFLQTLLPFSVVDFWLTWHFQGSQVFHTVVEETLADAESKVIPCLRYIKDGDRHQKYRDEWWRYATTDIEYSKGRSSSLSSSKSWNFVMWNSMRSTEHSLTVSSVYSFFYNRMLIGCGRDSIREIPLGRPSHVSLTSRHDFFYSGRYSAVYQSFGGDDLRGESFSRRWSTAYVVFFLLHVVTYSKRKERMYIYLRELILVAEVCKGTRTCPDSESMDTEIRWWGQ